MAFLDKLQFWKKKDDFSDLGLDFDKDPINITSNKGASPSDLNPIGTKSSDFLGKKGPSEFDDHYTYKEVPFERQPIGGIPKQSQQPQMPQQQPVQNTELSKDVEIMNYKLDAIRATLESINQRLLHLERLAKEQEKPLKRKTW